MKNEELKPCPFCGGKAEIVGSRYFAWVVCTDKKCGGEGGIGKSKEEAIKAWNRREK